MATSHTQDEKKDSHNKESTPKSGALQALDTAKQPADPNPQPEVVWNDGNMMTTFANVVNIQSSPEQLDICFGTNHTWNVGNKNKVKVELTNRIIMNPMAAKRLLQALGRVLQQHESRYGKMSIE